MKKFTIILTLITLFFGNVFGQSINENRCKMKELLAYETRFTDRINWQYNLYKTKANENEFLTTYWDNDKLNPYENKINKSFVIDLKEYVNPVKTKTITSHFGHRSGRQHQGVDLAASIGDTIYAAFDGKVRMSKYNRSGYGFFIIIRHTNGTETLYAHLSRMLVKQNQIVKGGEPIALSGNSGRSTGPHLHFEIRYMGVALNPEKLIDFTTHVPLFASVMYSDELKHGTHGIHKHKYSKGKSHKKRS